MTLADVSDLTWLSWYTVKWVVQKHLEHDYGRPSLKALKYLAVDEIYVGKRKKFYCSVQKSNDIKPPPRYTWCLASERKIGSGRSAFGAI